jgi:nitric oxide reductase NorD protein
MTNAETAYQHPLMQAYWAQLDTRFKQVEDVFEDVMAEALAILTREDIHHYLDAARVIGKLGRGVEPLLVFLEEWPSVAKAIGDEAALPEVMAFVMKMQKSPNGKAITPFLQTLAPVARRLHSRELMGDYLEIALDMLERTTGSIHGHHTTFPSPGLPDFFTQAPFLLSQLSLAGLKNWVEYGIRNYRTHPERQKDYFTVQSADSRAVLQRERHGTLFMDVERKLDLYLRGLWRESEQLVPYSTAFDELRKPVPYFDKLGMRIPDVYDDAGQISGLDRYRATLAHMVGHRRWTEAQIADNWSPFQRMAVEFFEDCRVETLLCREYPGLRRIFLALHPKPAADACDPETTSCLRHRMAMLSRALLDPDHGYRDADLLDFVARFHALMAEGTSSTKDIAALALSYVAKTRRQSDQLAKIHFADTVVDYRDDNRQMWKFIEEGDEEEAFDAKRKLEPGEELKGLPPRHYPEWDYKSLTYRPDWVSVYEALHPKGNPADIDRLLEKHSALAKRLKRILDLLKPQDKIRIRYQEEGSELDLDVAIRSLIDFKGGANPDPRINMSHRTDGRNIAVMLLAGPVGIPQREGIRIRADHPGTQPGSRLPAGLGGGTTGRPLRHRRLPLQHPPRRALPAHQGLRRTLGRRAQGPPGRHAGRLVHSHGRRHAPCRPLPGSAQGRQEAHAHPHRRPAQRRGHPRRTTAHRGHPPGREGTRPGWHLHLLHQPGPEGRRVCERHLRPPVHGDRQHPAPAGKIAGTLSCAHKVSARNGNFQ